MIKRQMEYTFKENVQAGRHGWLRLTPAYSAKAVQHILTLHPTIGHVLDPFAGSGTTGLVCAEKDIACDLVDINPFLVWFGRVKTAHYLLEQIVEAREVALEIEHLFKIVVPQGDKFWVPTIHQIERWWSPSTLHMLSFIYHHIQSFYPSETPSKNLLLVAFCRLLIEKSNAAFNHQSMSFKADATHEAPAHILGDFVAHIESIGQSASKPLQGHVSIYQTDARDLTCLAHKYDTVITSPPYPNRMSYIRELRPYMYWLGYLHTAQQAGELDWQAIGGTWGIATSRLNQWLSNGVSIPFNEFQNILAKIRPHSLLLANYVHKYFIDVATHLMSLAQVMYPGGRVFYVVGNSKFYETLVPTEQIYAALLEASGFKDIRVEILRKRNSKKELREYLLSAEKI